MVGCRPGRKNQHRVAFAERDQNAAKPVIIFRTKHLPTFLCRVAAFMPPGQLPWSAMFSYRHGFHAGNHADVLKHCCLITVMRHLTLKDAALTVVDTHAGAGLYRLDSDLAQTAGEALDGIHKLLAWMDKPGKAATPVAPALLDYVKLLRSFNHAGSLKIYPGSPFVAQHLMRLEARDRLRLFEMHPTDAKALAANIAQLGAHREISVARQDGFEGLRSLLPPPNRRALVLIDPSYEIKSDYAKVSTCIQDALKRFPTGTYMVWYPIVPRPEAHDLPRKLRAAAQRAGRSWLHATLNIGHPETGVQAQLPSERRTGTGLSASGVVVINPPHTLQTQLAAALPQMLAAMSRGAGKGFSLDAG